MNARTLRAQAPAPDAPHLFALAFEHAAVGIALVALDGSVLHANPSLCNLLGYNEAELRRCGMRGIVEADDLQQEIDSRLALLEGSGTTDRFDLRLRNKRGRTVWSNLTRVLARSPDGEPLYFVDQVQDLTEQRRAEKEIVLLNNLLEQRIQRRTRELEESNQDLREFAYSIAHDLRGPLASIDGFTVRLQQGLEAQLDERNAHYLRRVRAGVQRMAELTDGLLALADISRTELDRSSVDLSAIAASIIERLREQDPQRPVSVTIDATPPAQGDRRLLANVMENLISNAWKFTGRTAQARITFGVEAEAGAFRYFVRDNGAGFDPEHAAKLFSPFQRLHAANEFQGTGIGLALVRKILVRHGGQIWAEAQPGEGACFYFTLGH